MRELSSPDEVVDYCKQQGWIGPGPARAEMLTGGVSNVVYRVEAGEQLFVLKQSRAQLRTRDTWLSDVGRVWREVEAMEILHGLLPALTVPHVLRTSRPDYVFIMTHAPRHARVWKEQLLAGEVDLATGFHAGLILGRIHQATSARVESLVELHDRSVFVQLRVEPFYQRLQKRFPDLGPALCRLIEQLMEREDALTHGDFSPKNILAHEHGFTLVDYETAHIGDPTMDLGFFLSHLFLKACKHAPQRHLYFELIRRFVIGYSEQVRFCPPKELLARSVGHLGACLLTRIDGTSPVDYLPEEPRRQVVRRLARTFLLDGPGTEEEVLEVAEREMSSIS